MKNIVLVLSMLLTSCSAYSSNEISAMKLIEVVNLERGASSGGKAQKNVVIRSGEEFADLWKTVHKSQSPPAEIPPVNFNQNAVVAVFMGEKNTGGYSIEIKEIVAGKDAMTVRYLEQTPSPGMMLTQAFTAPYHIVKIPATNKKIVFEKIQ